MPFPTDLNEPPPRFRCYYCDVPLDKHERELGECRWCHEPERKESDDEQRGKPTSD
jgi:hypothetical protein